MHGLAPLLLQAPQPGIDRGDRRVGARLEEDLGVGPQLAEHLRDALQPRAAEEYRAEVTLPPQDGGAARDQLVEPAEVEAVEPIPVHAAEATRELRGVDDRLVVVGPQVLEAAPATDHGQVVAGGPAPGVAADALGARVVEEVVFLLVREAEEGRGGGAARA